MSFTRHLVMRSESPSDGDSPNRLKSPCRTRFKKDGNYFYYGLFRSTGRCRESLAIINRLAFDRVSQCCRITPKCVAQGRVALLRLDTSFSCKASHLQD